MGEEVEFHLSLADRNHLHEGFRMEASRKFIFPILTLSALSAQRVKALALLVNSIKELAVPDFKRQQEPTLCYKGESAPSYSIVGKKIQMNPCPNSLKGAQASVDIFGATSTVEQYNNTIKMESILILVA